MKHYDPTMCEDAERLYSEGRYSDCVVLALNAYQLARSDAEDNWKEMLKGPLSELAALTLMWDTTTQRNLRYDDYLKFHNWEDDISPAPLVIAAKALRKQAKEAIKNKHYLVALNYFEEIEKIGQITESDGKMRVKLLSNKF